MEYRTLGSTGVRVSTHCLGTMMFGPWGSDDAEDCARIVLRAIDGGINFVDSADMYSEGRSEEIVGLALKGSIRDDVVLATKFHDPMDRGQNQGGTPTVDHASRRGKLASAATSSPAPTSVWTPPLWTRSTKWCRPERSWTRTIAASPPGGSSPPRAGAGNLSGARGRSSPADDVAKENGQRTEGHDPT